MRLGIGVIDLSRENLKNLTKVFVIFMIYLIYNGVFHALFELLNIQNSIITMFAGDVCFLVFMIVLYWKKIKQNFLDLKKGIWENFIRIIIGVVVLFIVNMLVGIIGELLFSTANISDDNTQSIYTLSQVSFIYTVFKTMIFGVIAEELLFKQSLREVMPNNVLFVISCSLLYAVMNVIYGDLSSPYLLSDALSYFAVSAALAYMYIKNNDNIVLVMFVKFFYNLIPMCIMIAGML